MTSPESIAWNASVEIATSSIADPSTPPAELTTASGRLSARVQALTALDTDVAQVIEPLLNQLGTVDDPTLLRQHWQAIQDRLSVYHGGSGSIGFR